ncbi:hypothetical protein O988_07294 [Pseudogymnoascus sp. VKM F-3808]|nr:hypothetical protein O988_07294 [Pseudogymnoascus sp. VKM F-3808]
MPNAPELCPGLYTLPGLLGGWEGAQPFGLVVREVLRPNYPPEHRRDQPQRASFPKCALGGGQEGEMADPPPSPITSSPSSSFAQLATAPSAPTTQTDRSAGMRQHGAIDLVRAVPRRVGDVVDQGGGSGGGGVRGRAASCLWGGC